ncbi:conserved hypothetical protein [Pseudomonas sp. 9AZ]|uniref:lysozyme inhibitor LprI family protein n=1 Tax=Pseudomonas sp. 9AZ TaxID=2653168 RepID=UPI0012F0BA7B|nr:lysozyme inhibitor LprI family protein [Pseudomonas sp. 9AZ]VXC88179.1 conserved hypothetical protein [Pseudomonas sp. 9AZ]
MSDRKASTIAFATCIFLINNHALAESQAEYSEASNNSWQQQNELTEKSYQRLLLEAGAEENKEAIKQLKEAKEKWEEFRTLFCNSVSSTYGGQWTSVHESECRVKIAEQLQSTTDSYGW